MSPVTQKCFYCGKKIEVFRGRLVAHDDESSEEGCEGNYFLVTWHSRELEAIHMFDKKTK